VLNYVIDNDVTDNDVIDSRMNMHTLLTSRPNVVDAMRRARCERGQYASRPGNRIYCYAELVVSSLVVAETIAGSPVLILPTHGGMARLSMTGWLWLNSNFRERSPIPVLTGPDVEQLR